MKDLVEIAAWVGMGFSALTLVAMAWADHPAYGAAITMVVCAAYLVVFAVRRADQ